MDDPTQSSIASGAGRQHPILYDDKEQRETQTKRQPAFLPASEQTKYRSLSGSFSKLLSFARALTAASAITTETHS